MKTHKVIVSLDICDIVVDIHEINGTYEYDYASSQKRLQANELHDSLYNNIEYHYNIKDKQKFKDDIQKIIEA